MKKTEDQKQTNDFIKNQFVTALMHLDLQLIESMLDDTSIFLNNFTKLQMMYWFKKKLINVKGQYEVNLNEGICLDKNYDGAESLEFIFTPEVNFSFNYSLDELINNPNQKISIVIEIVLAYRDGKIVDIVIPNKCVGKELKFLYPIKCINHDF